MSLYQKQSLKDYLTTSIKLNIKYINNLFIRIFEVFVKEISKCLLKVTIFKLSDFKLLK